MVVLPRVASAYTGRSDNPQPQEVSGNCSKAAHVSSRKRLSDIIWGLDRDSLLAQPSKVFFVDDLLFPGFL